jgi:hypothetical protein
MPPPAIARSTPAASLPSTSSSPWPFSLRSAESCLMPGSRESSPGASPIWRITPRIAL